jgi:hypothetical protein
MKFRHGSTSCHGPTWSALHNGVRLLFSQEDLMKRLLLFLMVVAAMSVGMTWGNATVEGASAVNSQQYQPKQVTKFKLEGDGAFAHFSNSDGCGTTDAQVGANDDASKEGSGKAEITSRVFLNIYLDNFCTGQFIFFASDLIIPPEAFTVGDKLESATLDTVVDACCDSNGASFPVNINLTWTATGRL